MSKLKEKNSRQQINISKQGVQISYRRFLSDSAGGFLFIISISLMIIFEVSPFNDIDLSKLKSISTEVKAFFILILFLLATPIGLLINATSWFLFGIVDVKNISKIASRDSYLSRGTKSIYRFEKLIQFFKIKNIQNDFFDRAIEVKEIIDFYYPQISRETDTSTGARRLTRSFSLICLFSVVFLLIGIMLSLFEWKANFSNISINLIIIILLLSLIFLFIKIQSHLRFYDIVHILSNAYLICITKENELDSFDKIKSYLIKNHYQEEIKKNEN